MKEPSLFEAGCPRIEVAICRKSSSVMSGRNRLLTCDKRALSAIDSSTTDSMSKDKGKATKAIIPTSPEKKEKEEKLAEFLPMILLVIPTTAYDITHPRLTSLQGFLFKSRVSNFVPGIPYFFDSTGDP